MLRKSLLTLFALLLFAAMLPVYAEEPLWIDAGDFEAEAAPREGGALLLETDENGNDREAAKALLREQLPLVAAGRQDCVWLTFYGDEADIGNYTADVLYYTLYDYPEALYYFKTGYRYSIRRSASDPHKYQIGIIPKMLADYNALAYAAAVDKACVDCFGAVDPANADLSDFEKALLAHDYLDRLCLYDPAVADGVEPAEESYTSYGVFVKRVAVCQGYALAYKVLLDRAGVECCYVKSTPINHGWNAVKIGGSWRHVDVTWDDPGYKGIRDYAGRVEHKQFLLSDADRLAYIQSRDSGTASMTAEDLWESEYGIVCPETVSLPEELTASVSGVFLRKGKLMMPRHYVRTNIDGRNYVLDQPARIAFYEPNSDLTVVEIKDVDGMKFGFDAAAYDGEEDVLYARRISINGASDNGALYAIDPENASAYAFGVVSDDVSRGLALDTTDPYAKRLYTELNDARVEEWIAGSGYLAVRTEGGFAVTLTDPAADGKPLVIAAVDENGRVTDTAVTALSDNMPDHFFDHSGKIRLMVFDSIDTFRPSGQKKEMQ